jgi:hypothetical protein
MLQLPISHSPDLKRLRDEGYEIEICGGHLIIRHIPYVNNKCEVKYGFMVSELTLANPQRTAAPGSHTMHFGGEAPCHKDGVPIAQIINSSKKQKIAGIDVDHYFSSKPKSGRYDDYYTKVTTYVNIVSSPAKALDKAATAQTFKVITESDNSSVLQYLDTNSSRANINVINQKLAGQKIAIIGLGGTGSYILDFLAKTPVLEIHLFDADDFLQHNAFRSPGAATIEQLGEKMKKVEYCFKVYYEMHKGIVAHSKYITNENIHMLNHMDYIFICIDKNEIKSLVIDYLLQLGISFIDVGLGVNAVDDCLIGTIRVTTGTKEKNDHLARRISREDGEENEYATNIQIAELNALNAALAIIKWKKLSGFYQDLEQEHHSTYSINVSQLLNEETTA